MTDSNDRIAPHDAINTLVAQNIQTLQELRHMLSELSEEQYQSVQAPLESSIGAHIRHIIECYEQFAKHQSGELLNYDHRARCAALETQPKTAVERIDWLCTMLRSVRGDAPLQLRQITAAQIEVDTHSSTGRELSHLIDHATHHLAMVNVAGKLAQMPISRSLGYSVATLQHQHNQSDTDDAVSAHA